MGFPFDPVGAGLVYNVKSYGAFGDGVHDDTVAIQAWQTAAGVNGGIAYAPPGTYLLSKSVTVASNVWTCGAGEGVTIFQAATTFSGSGNRGLFELTSGSFINFSDMTLDPGPSSDSAVCGIHQQGGAIQHFHADHIYCELSSGGVHHIGCLLEGLGQGTDNSYDINFSRIYGHNGAGTIALYANSSGTYTYHTVKIDKITNRVDVSGVTDDRVAVVGANTDSATQIQLFSIRVQHVSTYVTAAASGGTVNSVKLDPGEYTYLHDALVSDVDHVVESGGSLGFPFASEVETGANIDDIALEDISGTGTNRITIRFAANSSNQRPYLSLKGIRLNGNLDTVGMIEVYTSSQSFQREQLVINDFVLNSSVPGGSYTTFGPIGILLTSGSSLQGISGQIDVSDGIINGCKTPIANNVLENGSATTPTAYSAMVVKRVKWMNTAGTYGNGSYSSGSFAIRDCPGYNPVGSSVPGTAFSLPASGTAWTNNTGVDGTLFVTGAGAVTDVVVQGVTVASSLSVGQSFFVPAGGTITFTYTTAPTLVFVGN